MIWVQGCKHHCRNCFNPATHPFTTNNRVDTTILTSIINQQDNICGVTFSGGEPLEYSQAILEMIQGIRTGLSVILYSGYSLDEVLSDKDKTKVMMHCDLSILGRYDDNLPHPYMGKKFVRTSDKIDMDYFKKLYNIEYLIQNKHIVKSGIFKTNQHGL